MGAKSVRAVERAIDVLDAIRARDGTAGVSEISRDLGLPKSTVYRLLVALSNKGMVRKNGGSDLYSFGRKILEMSFATFPYQDIISSTVPCLEELRDRLGETAALALKIGHRYAYVTQVVSLHEYRVNPVLARHYPLHWAATGKSMLAFVSPQELEECLSLVPNDRATPRTVTDPAVLVQQLEEIRRVGYAASFGERSEGAAAIAAPIRDSRGLAIAAVCIVGPESRVQQMDLDATGKVVVEIARRIEITCQVSGLDALLRD
jgi:DNA-binding IclR family transcriptional regulator